MLSDIVRHRWRQRFLKCALVFLCVMAGSDSALTHDSGLGDRMSRPTVSMRPIRVARDANGLQKHGERDESDSSNWSGYALTRPQTGVKYTSVSGSWIVPEVSNEAAPTTAQNSAGWVGIGGGCEDSACSTADDTLIQVGTEQDANADGTTNYYAWYELLPTFSTIIPHPVQPGDAMTASVRCVASCALSTQTWVIAISDSTAGWNWTKTVTYASSEISAEWIEEAPSSTSNTIDTLVDFGFVTFTSLSVNGATPVLSLATNGLELRNPESGVTGNPSAPQSDGSFSVCAGSFDDYQSCPYFGNGSPLVAAVLPSSRAAVVNGTVTAYATIINGGKTDGVGCSISSLFSVVAVSYQATDATTNALVGSQNTPVSIPAGKSQSFIISLTPVNFGFEPALPMKFDFACTNLPSVNILFNLNTLLLSASLYQRADVIALAATTTSDGTLHIAGSTGVAAFAVAAANVGTGDSITAQASVTGQNGAPVSVSICETIPATGQCQSPVSPSVTTTINAGDEPTFSIFATADGTVPFNPATNRIFVQFTDSYGTVVGMTSVAVATN